MANRLAQPVQVPEAVKTPGLEQLPILRGDTGGAQYFGEISKAIGGLGSEIGQVADTAAAVEGKEAGYTAGLDPEFRPTQDDPSIRGRAFNASAIATYELTQKQAIADKAQTIADAHPKDPKAVQAAFERLNSEYTDSTFPQMKPIFAVEIDRYRLAAVRGATRAAEAAATAARKEALSASITSRFSALDRATYSLGLDDKADEVLAGQLESIRQDLGAAVKRGDITQGAADATLKQAENTVAASRILGAFDRLPSLDAKKQFAEDMARRYSKSEGDFAKIDPATMQKVQAAIGGRLKGDLAQIDALGKTTASTIDSFTDTATTGLLPTPAQMSALRAQVAMINDPVLSQKAAVAEHVLSLTELGRKMSLPELDATIAGMNKAMTEKGATPEAMLLRDTAVKLRKNMGEAIDQDQLAWADRVGVAKIAPLDFSKPADDIALQMRARADQAETVGKYYGKPPVYLTAAERDQLSRVTANGGPAMLAAAKAISDGFGTRAPAVIGEIGANAPVMAHVGALLTVPGAEPFAADVAEGLQLKAQENLPAAKRTIELPNWVKSAPDKLLTAQKAEVRSVFGDAFALSPDSGRAAEETARQAFNARAVRGSIDPTPTAASLPSPAAALFDRTLQQAAGARFTPDGTQYGGVAKVSSGLFSSAKVLVPPDVRADKFPAVLGAITDADLQALPAPPKAADGKPYSARDLHNAVPVAVRGGYRFAFGDVNSDNPKWLRGANGEPFVLDLDALRPALKQRVPDAFLGGR